MTKKILVLLILLFSVLPASEDHQFTFDVEKNEIIRISQWRYQYGDSIHWSEPDFRDSSWILIHANNLPEDKRGIRWYRAKIELTGRADEYDLLTIYLPGLVTAYDLFWDGQLISRNGTVGKTRSEEQPGSINKIIKLKQTDGQAGCHTLAIRLSNHLQQAPNNIFFVQMGYYSDINSRLTVQSYWLQFSAGLFLLASIFSFALFLGGGRNRSYFLFSVYCILNVLYAVLAFLLNYIDISSEYLTLYNSLVFLIAPFAVIFLNVFFIYKYDLDHKIRHIGLNIILAILILIIFGYNGIVYLSLYAILLLALAIHKKEPGSIISFIGTLTFVVLLIMYAQGWVFQLYNMGEVFFVFCITLSISYQIRKQNQQLEKSRLRSARLEAELLRKNIQPHFLMNTLLSIISWIEEHPATAQKLIQALANEFKLINKISAEKEISVQEEIMLCRSHLKLMGYRKDATFSLILEDIPLDQKVPPMIFHTLIENGLTHAFKTGENGTFRIAFSQQTDGVTFVIKNNGSLLKKYRGDSPTVFREGMGMKYIKTRLEESYPGKWEIQYGLKEGMWEVRIRIQK